MKIQELLNEILTSGEYSKPKDKFGIVDEMIYGEDLEQFKERILQTEEFSECEELIIMKHPVVQNPQGEVLQSKIYKVSGENKHTFKGKCYLLSLALTPEMFDPKKLHEPVLDGACITPTLYDPKTFEPKKKIILEFSPEMAQDQILNSGEDIIRKQLHETLDKVFDTPENYQVKGEKGILIRGFFEDVSNKDTNYKMDLIGLQTEKQTHSMVYFFEKDEKNSTEGQVNLKLSTIPIPIELRDKFVEELGPKSIHVTREEVEEFLKNNEENPNS